MYQTFHSPRFFWGSTVALLSASLLLPPCSAVADEGPSPQASIIIGGLLPEEGGDWDPETSPLKSPFGIDFNTGGDMFIVELEGGRIHKLAANGQLHHVSGDGSKSYKGDGKSFSEATYNGMHNCAVTQDGDLYIADSWNHCIRKVDANTGIITTFAGTGESGFSGDGGSATTAQFDFVMCITLNHANDVIHVADLKNRRVRAVNLKTGVVSTIAGNGSQGVPTDGAKSTDSPLVDPRAVAADSQGNVYILERSGHALRVVRPDGSIHTVAGTGESGFRDGPALGAQFGSPKHICVDDADNVYIADDQNNAIRRYDPITKTVSTVLGRGFGDDRIQLSHPHGVCWQDGRLFVVDMGHHRLLSVSEKTSR